MGGAEEIIAQANSEGRKFRLFIRTGIGDNCGVNAWINDYLKAQKAALDSIPADRHIFVEEGSGTWRKKW